MWSFIAKMLKMLESKRGIIASGVISIAMVIIFLSLQRTVFYMYGGEIVFHISGIEIFASIVLIVGVLKDKHQFLLPWMIMTALFIYSLIYTAIESFYIEIYFQVIAWFLVLIFTSYLSCALYAVYNKFQEMRSATSPAISQSTAPPAYSPIDEKMIRV
ncbi:uncharacterized protein LOC115622439 [Scaptodrosophila lebanonensis]|uniref:Uncharacterized protein LOC115622439 n=1 Tax=Drosophila lebanonensis TaxID=7225 RepID=A0A6J2T5P2_DROLE|nr:uncharacterized protein LOC115622439 [Scaptodrosophila lebanonensis]